ncbi:hypothetical protein POM88_046513 [Heracleum sosnowskyi]|uniref:F-box domain-containing protein n=1 Tax=Heracleum sosnowskyi TaxID=360622 RepID=A0AAD8H942_9APIA|nr:hypothetical protein POM88_046513 [Heracleum sosnowskyi]
MEDDDNANILFWCQQDAVLLTWIYVTISPYLLVRLGGQQSSCTSAREAWERLRDICRDYDITMQKKKRRYIYIDLNEDFNNQGGDDDRAYLLSNLPDELLIDILSLAADMKTAGRTSILSKRWTSLWTHLMDLDFNLPETCSYAAHVDNWIKFAFDKEVRNLDHSLSVGGYTYPSVHFSNIICTSSPDNTASSEHHRKLVISSLKLKHLEFFRSLKALNIDALHLSAPNLTSFLCSEFKIDVEFRSVPSLVDVTLGDSYLHHLFIWMPYPCFLLSLKNCRFGGTRMSCGHLAGATVSLGTNNTQSKAIRSHQHLKVVEYLGYAGGAGATELALSLTWHAPMLQRFIFDTRQPEYVGKPLEVIYTSNYKDQMQKARGTIELLAEQIRRRPGFYDVGLSYDLDVHVGSLLNSDIV